MHLNALFLSVLSVTLSASFVALLVMALRLLFRKAPRGMVCALWLLLALRLLVWQLPTSQVSVVPEALSSGSVVSKLEEVYPGPLTQTAENVAALRESGRQAEAPVISEAPGQAAPATQPNPPTAAKPLGEQLLSILPFLWAGGVVLMFLFMVGSYGRIWKKSRLSVRQEGNVYHCDEPGTPFVFGLIRPRIYIPSDLSAEARACVLAHERAHIARKDPLWKLLAYLLLCLHWFNPILWLSFVMLCRDMERACDERAIKDKSLDYRKAYSAALLSLSAPKSWISACPLAFGEVGIKERVTAALHYKKPAVRTVAALVLVALLAAGCTLTNPTASTTGAGTAEAPTAPKVEQGHIYLYGEMRHHDMSILEQELALWGGFYAQGVRDLFMEMPCYCAEYLNQWMRADSDAILDQLFRDWGEIHDDITNDLILFRQIKKDYPETVFHGTDVGHSYQTTGERFLADLRAAGGENTETYTLAQENMEQGKLYHAKVEADRPAGTAYASTYRENCMTQNFIREYEKLSGATVVGLFGAPHTNPESMNYYGTVYSMARQLALRYKDILHSQVLFYAAEPVQPLRLDRLQIAGKEYEAAYFGVQDLSQSPFPYQQREYWRLENAYTDFANNPRTGEVLPYHNFPMEIENGQVFVIAYTRDDGSIEHRYYRSDGDLWNGQQTTVAFSLGE